MPSPALDVVLWSIANEPDTVRPEARVYLAPLAAEARRLDPTRPVAYVNALMGEPGQWVVTDVADGCPVDKGFGCGSGRRACGVEG